MGKRLARIRDWYLALPPRQADFVLAVLALTDAVVEVVATSAPTDDTRIATALAPLVAIAVFIRRRAPVTGVALGFSFIVAIGLLDQQITESVGGPFLVCVFLVFSMAMRAEGPALWVGLVLGLALVELSVLTDQYEDNATDALMAPLMVVAGPATLGRLARHRTQLNRALREKAADAQEQRVRAAEEAVVEERERIAGELHDVVAHTLGAMTVQASAARRLAGQDPDRARQAFLAVEETGREALSELRRLLGVLRREDEDLALAPQPRLAFVRDLVRRVRAAGLPTTLTVEGDPPAALSPGVDLTGYRIVQEALRAAQENGGAGRAEVRVLYRAGDIAIEVADDGRGDQPRPMLGMAERVRVYGGELVAGPGGAGYRLRARLPVEVAP